MPRSWAGACTRKEGCIKPAGHKGACKLGAFEEEEFEVEKILEQRDGRGGQVEYLVKWRGWEDRFNSWEPSRPVLSSE